MCSDNYPQNWEKQFGRIKLVVTGFMVWLLYTINIWSCKWIFQGNITITKHSTPTPNPHTQTNKERKERIDDEQLTAPLNPQCLCLPYSTLLPCCALRFCKSMETVVVKYPPNKDTLKSKISKGVNEGRNFDTYAIFCFYFLYKCICCGCSLELLRLVEAIQMSINNICFYIEV